jgi:hypothetical protein
MLSFSIAQSLAAAWVNITTEGRAALVLSSTVAKPYGWVFFYLPSEYMRDPSNHLNQLAGNAPLLVDRINGEIRVLGTARPLEWYLSKYEETLPEAVLLMRPEPP